AEDHGMDGAEPRACEHRDDGVGHDRDVDDHAVALLDSLAPQHAGAERYRVPQLAVGVRTHRAGDGAVVHERALLAAPAIDVQVERVVAGVQLAAGEPAVEGLARIVEHTVPGSVPVNVRGGRGPEAFGVAHRSRVCLAIDALRHVRPSCAPSPGRLGNVITTTGCAQRGPSMRQLPPGSRFLLTISIDNGY